MAVIEVNIHKEQKEKILINGNEDPDQLAYKIALKHGIFFIFKIKKDLM